jgi:hypothetical protein
MRSALGRRAGILRSPRALRYWSARLPWLVASHASVHETDPKVSGRRRDAWPQPWSAKLQHVIEVEEFVERLCLLGADRGPRRFPRKQRDRQILMKSIVMLLESARTYTESEINELLCTWKREIAPAIETDHVMLRRHLVDYGHLERTADGSSYRMGFPPSPVAFDFEIDGIDQGAMIAAYRDQVKRRPRPPER